jgi:hypothetical protein
VAKEFIVWYAGLRDVERLESNPDVRRTSENNCELARQRSADYQESVLARIAREVREGKNSGIQERNRN